ncbi:MAG TPA: DNA repair protein RecO [Steroidobacteraceae bacterium]|nr:DNA repair protein RecO [Steroidobacteraceae bacterium]
MNRHLHRARLAPAYVLHHRPYRDTSRILEVLTREHGRMSVFARGVRGPRARLAAVLQPFRPLLLSYSGGEAPSLTAAEGAAEVGELPPASLMSGFYLNELLMKLTTRHDVHPGLFDAYEAALERLRMGGPPEPALRVFEKRLLAELGYGLDLAADIEGRPIEAGSYYHFRPGEGLAVAAAGVPGAARGGALLALELEQLEDRGQLDELRVLLGAAVAHALEGREIATREVARACQRLRLAR